jgi:hypothetical protein
MNVSHETFTFRNPSLLQFTEASRKESFIVKVRSAFLQKKEKIDFNKKRLIRRTFMRISPIVQKVRIIYIMAKDATIMRYSTTVGIKRLRVFSEGYLISLPLIGNFFRKLSKRSLK